MHYRRRDPEGTLTCDAVSPECAAEANCRQAFTLLLSMKILLFRCLISVRAFLHTSGPYSIKLFILKERDTHIQQCRDIQRELPSPGASAMAPTP
jgi:hypothetical protein